jgi:hypothetical protein
MGINYEESEGQTESAVELHEEEGLEISYSNKSIRNI